MYNFVKNLIHTARTNWLTMAFILGFFTDLILLNRIDDLLDNLILLFYVLLATISMLSLYAGVAEKGPAFLSRGFKKYSPIFMQYAFGGLLSGMLIFYGRSGDLLAGAPFLALILAVIVGNELVSKRSDRLVYNLALYFIGLFSYVVLVVPVITGKMGDLIFILSGLGALLVVTFVIKLLYQIVPNFIEANVSRIILTIGFIYIGFNALYFTNLIPPIPLSLNDLELVQKVNLLESGGYRVESEIQPWYRKIPFARQVLHPTGSSIACFSRVYAPTKLSTKIYHRWEYKDESGKWQQHFRFGYDISGINNGGYGGYTEIKGFFSGVWRCSVETERGQVLGRRVVRIDTSGSVKSTGKNQVQIR